MIDTHCHLTYPDYQADLSDVLERARLVGVTEVIVPATNVESSKQGAELAERYRNVYVAAGVHPLHAHEVVVSWERELGELVSGSQFTALGEIGLDFARKDASLSDEEFAERLEKQRGVLAAQLSIAHQHNLPIIVHSRDCFSELYGTLKQKHHGKKAVIHCFTGTRSEAYQWLDLGYLLSFTGILTYKKSDELREVVASLPLDRIMVETDGPYLAPEGHRGKRCEPAHVRNVAECIAEITGTPIEVVDQTTSHTARNFFNITG